MAENIRTDRQTDTLRHSSRTAAGATVADLPHIEKAPFFDRIPMIYIIIMIVINLLSLSLSP